MQEHHEQYLSLSALEQYRRLVHATPQLTEEEETTLLQQHTSESARTRLVAGYQPMVLGMAKRYHRRAQEMDLMDLVQEGNEGLLRALGAYDGHGGEASFRTWAYAWLRGMMYHALLREGAIPLPRRKVEAMRLMDEITSDLHCLLGREPTVDEIARDMGLTVSEVCELLLLEARQVVSLDAALDGDTEATLAETIEAPSSVLDEDCSSLDDVLRQLPEHERTVILVRYGFGETQTRTQAETAKVLGMRLEKVQELDRRARRRLRKALSA